MEPHEGKPSDSFKYFYGWGDPIEVIFKRALSYAKDYHADSLRYYQDLKLDDLQPHVFWSEYVWTVYASGFNAKVLTKKFKGLMNAIGPWHHSMPYSMLWSRVQQHIANERKARAVDECRFRMRSTTWDSFKQEYLSSVDTIAQLPFIGSITKYHLARNIGYDAVKPDIHLVRLSHHLGFSDVGSMCAYLAGLHDLRVGVVDFVLWSYCAAFGTAELS